MSRVATATLLALLAACTSSGTSIPAPTETTPAPSSAAGGPSAAAEMAKLCPPLPPASSRIPPARDVPGVVTRTEREVEAVRGLRFLHPVAVAAVGAREMSSRVERDTRQTLPAGQLRRRELAWQTIGALPAGTDLSGSVGRYLGTQVAGYYDAHAQELVVIGSLARPTPGERFVLAHELTHALDDQHFHLDRVDALQASCRDEAEQAATGAIEGSAVYFSTLVAQRYFTAAQRRAVQGGASATPPNGIPQFLLDQESWPYVAGPTFIAALAQRGGLAAVNAALQRLPDSTEQVMHPELYPSDQPVPVDVPEPAGALGAGWHDLDVEQIGEQWLLDLLELRLDPTEATPAAAGWGGGLYRSWANGANVGVVLRTVWDSPRDATEFARAMSDWILARQFAAATTDADRVDVVFATDRSTLQKLVALTT